MWTAPNHGAIETMASGNGLVMLHVDRAFADEEWWVSNGTDAWFVSDLGITLAVHSAHQKPYADRKLFIYPKQGPTGLEIYIDPTYCGDMWLVDPEQCDDGNSADGDGCR